MVGVSVGVVGEGDVEKLNIVIKISEPNNNIRERKVMYTDVITMNVNNTISKR